jgi:N,N'-diacetyllegionaminate synthase
MSRNYNIIAETAFSHEGNYNYLLSQIDEAIKGEVTYVKFQILLKPDIYYIKNHNALKDIGKFIFTEEQWLELLTYATKAGLKTIALPLEIASLDFCLRNEFLIEGIELHSVCFNEVPMLKALKNWNKLLFLGAGGRLSNEIEFVSETTKHLLIQTIIMCGFQSFPTNKFDLELNKIFDIRNKFNCKVGFADHTANGDSSFIDLCVFSYLLGAEYFEKHIVPKSDLKRIDGSSAVPGKDFIELKHKLEEINLVLGDHNFDELNEAEQNYRKREKIIVASVDLKEGQIIKENMLAYKISDQFGDINQNDFYSILGKKVIGKIKKDEPILNDKLMKC